MEEVHGLVVGQVEAALEQMRARAEEQRRKQAGKEGSRGAKAAEGEPGGGRGEQGEAMGTAVSRDLFQQQRQTVEEEEEEGTEEGCGPSTSGRSLERCLPASLACQWLPVAAAREGLGGSGPPGMYSRRGAIRLARERRRQQQQQLAAAPGIREASAAAATSVPTARQQRQLQRAQQQQHSPVMPVVSPEPFSAGQGWGALASRLWGELGLMQSVDVSSLAPAKGGNVSISSRGVGGVNAATAPPASAPAVGPVAVLKKPKGANSNKAFVPFAAAAAAAARQQQQLQRMGTEEKEKSRPVLDMPPSEAPSLPPPSPAAPVPLAAAPLPQAPGSQPPPQGLLTSRGPSGAKPKQRALAASLPPPAAATRSFFDLMGAPPQAAAAGAAPRTSASQPKAKLGVYEDRGKAGAAGGIKRKGAPASSSSSSAAAAAAGPGGGPGKSLLQLDELLGSAPPVYDTSRGFSLGLSPPAKKAKGG